MLGRELIKFALWCSEWTVVGLTLLLILSNREASWCHDLQHYFTTKYQINLRDLFGKSDTSLAHIVFNEN